MERLIPEGALALRREDAVADAGERRREDQRADGVGPLAGHELGHAAADVVADAPPAVEAELVDQADDGGRLLRRAVGLGGRPVVGVGLAEAAQVRHDDVGDLREPGHDRRVVRARARPAVEQHDGSARARAVVGEREAVDGSAARHSTGRPGSIIAGVYLAQRRSVKRTRG